jgi:hypothetical protein
VPAEQGGRSDQKAGPSLARYRPAGRGEKHPIDEPELRWAGLTPEDPELVAKDEDLEILGTIVAAGANQETGE